MKNPDSAQVHQQGGYQRRVVRDHQGTGGGHKGMIDNLGRSLSAGRPPVDKDTYLDQLPGGNHKFPVHGARTCTAVDPIVHTKNA